LAAAANRPLSYPAVKAAFEVFAHRPTKQTGLGLWRAYVFALSPAVKAYDWPKNGHDRDAWDHFDESVSALGTWEAGICICGCGRFVNAHGKVAHKSHLHIAWRRMCRVLLAELPPSAMPWQAIELAHSGPSALFSAHEFTAIRCLYYTSDELP
jgi:hypothetical protein